MAPAAESRSPEKGCLAAQLRAFSPLNGVFATRGVFFLLCFRSSTEERLSWNTPPPRRAQLLQKALRALRRSCVIVFFIRSTPSMSVVFFDLHTLARKSVQQGVKQRLPAEQITCCFTFFPPPQTWAQRRKRLFILQPTEGNQVLRCPRWDVWLFAVWESCFHGDEMSCCHLHRLHLPIFSGLTHICWHKQVPSFRAHVFTAVVFSKRRPFQFSKFTNQNRTHRLTQSRAYKHTISNITKETKQNDRNIRYLGDGPAPCAGRAFANKHAGLQEPKYVNGRFWPQYRFPPQASFSVPFSSHVLVRHPN